MTKHILKMYMYLLIFLLVISLFSTLNYKIISIISYIFVAALSLVSSIKYSKKSNKRGYISGLLIGVVFTITLFIASLLLTKAISLKGIIYYTSLILNTTIGGMIGINLKK